MYHLERHYFTSIKSLKDLWTFVEENKEELEKLFILNAGLPINFVMTDEVLDTFTQYLRQADPSYVLSVVDLFIVLLKGKDLRVYDLIFLLWSEGDHIDTKGCILLSTILAEGVELVAPSYEGVLLDENEKEFKKYPKERSINDC